MLNEGIKTSELHVAWWLLDPDALDQDVIESMRLPRGLSVESLLFDELSAISSYHRAWSENAVLDTGELFFRNSTCKRVLYISAPMFLPDTIPIGTLVPTGVNTRIHRYRASDVWDTIRLEAVSSYEVAGLRFRYALSIQYARDAVRNGWQVIRPVIVLDKEMLAAARGAGDEACGALRDVLASLRHLVLTGSHDYVHATVLNWFPPLTGLDPEYAAITSERVHPPEVQAWHQGTQLPLPDGIVPGLPTPRIATLELYSLLVHEANLGRLLHENPRLLDRVCELFATFSTALAALTDRLPGTLSRSVADYFTTLACWFLVSALPLGSPGLDAVLQTVSAEQVNSARDRLAEVHDGMFAVAGRADARRFPWQGATVDVNEVTREYERALRWPAISTYAEYLSGSRAAGGADGRVEMPISRAVGTDERSWQLAQALREIGASTGAERQRLLGRLARDGLLAQLRAAGGAGGAGAEEPVTGPERYARKVAEGLARLADAVLGPEFIGDTRGHYGEAMWRA